MLKLLERQQWQGLRGNFKRGVKGAQFRRLVRLFALNLTPPQIIDLTDLGHNTVYRYLFWFRQIIAEHCDAVGKLSGVVEVDESYFGPRRVRGKPGRGVGGKTIVFGIWNNSFAPTLTYCCITPVLCVEKLP